MAETLRVSLRVEKGAYGQLRRAVQAVSIRYPGERGELAAAMDAAVGMIERHRLEAPHPFRVMIMFRPIRSSLGHVGGGTWSVSVRG
jgi:hypothetical protein